jgi:hypothetical protein
VSLYLDKLVEDYNHRFKIQSQCQPLITGRVYSEEEEEEKEEEDITKLVAEKINELKDILSEINKKAARISRKIPNIRDEIRHAYRTALKVRHMSRKRIVSPRMYRRIMSYYRRYKNGKYYSRYKIDNGLHNFLMQMGRYLESLDKKMEVDVDYRYYALPSLALLISGGMKEILGYLSSAIIHAAHIVEWAVHAIVELSPRVLKSIPLLPTILPHFLVGCLIAFLSAGLLVIIGHVLHPEGTSKMKILWDKIKINIGIRKNYMYAAYIMYVYRLYDVLSAISSYIIEIGKLIQLGKEIDEEETAKKMEKKAKEGVKAVGLKDKALGLLADKIKIKPFEKSKNKMEALDKIIVVDLESYKELLDSVRKGNKKLNICGYKFSVSSDAVKKLVDYYGAKFQGGGEWIEVIVEYTGGAYHKAANPLKKIEIYGFNGNTKEAANFIGALLALSDKIVVDRIGEQEFENPLVVIDLQKLKVLSYKSKPFVDKLIAPINKLVNLIKKMITKEGSNKEGLDPSDIGNLMFEAYVKANKIEHLKSESESAAEEEENIITEEKEENSSDENEESSKYKSKHQYI